MLRVLFIATLLFLCQNAFPITAYPYPIFINTAKGGMYITLCGDETYKYALTSDGYLLSHIGDKWMFAYVDDGNIIPSEFAAEAEPFRSNALNHFLNSNTCKIKAEDNVKLNCIQRSIQQIKQRNNVPVTGKRKVLVILMDYPDCKMSKSNADFDQLFNMPNYSTDGARGSVYDYYNYVSYGQLDLQCDVLGPYRAEHEMAYYGGNVGFDGHDKNPYALFEEALKNVTSHVELSDYDSDGDGYVDNIHIIYAGHGEEAGASSESIWAHEMTFETIKSQGMKIDRYSCAPELRSNLGNGISRIGPHCHEIGHALGAMDYYDTNYDEGGKYDGTGTWDVMASGSWNDSGISPANFNPYVKSYIFGWNEITELTNDGNFHCLPSNTNNTTFRISTSRDNEFFLIENRQQRSFDSSTAGHGLLIYHVDTESEGIKRNTINATYPQRCYIVCASSNYRQPTSSRNSYGEINSAGCPFPGDTKKSEFGSNTVPAALCYNGSFAGFQLINIQEYNDGIVEFDFSLDDTPSTPIEPEEGNDIVFTDSFESFFMNSIWTQVCKEYNTPWKVQMDMSDSVINGSLQLLPSFTPFDKLPRRCVTTLQFPLSSLDKGKYVVSLRMSSSGESKNGIDSIKVYMSRYSQEGISSFPIMDKAWTKHRVLIDNDYNSDYLCIEGICYEGSALKIDDITISKFVEDGIHTIQRADNIHPYTKYDISGKKATVISNPKVLIIDGRKYIYNK